MVRLKHRYLLLEILYPDPSTWPITTKDIPGKPPSHLAIHAPTPDTLTAGLLAKMVREEVAELFGDWGVGQLGGAGINVKYLSPATSTAILRCPRSSYRLVWSALTYMSHVPDVSPRGHEKRVAGRPCVFRVIRVSGTMRKAEEEAVRRARREIVRVRGLEGGVLGGLVGDVEVSKDSARGVLPVVDDSADEDEDEDEDMAEEED